MNSNCYTIFASDMASKVIDSFTSHVVAPRLPSEPPMLPPNKHALKVALKKREKKCERWSWKRFHKESLTTVSFEFLWMALLISLRVLAN